MLDFPRWKTIGISLILLFGIVFSIPSFLPEKTFDRLPSFAQVKVNLGLDLAGGSHLLLEADVGDLQKTQLANMEKTVRAAMRGERGADDDIAIGELSTAGDKISFLVRDQKQLDEARDRLFKETRGAAMTGQRDWQIDVIDTTRLVLTPTAAGQKQAVANAMDTARDIIDKRVNALGTREPTIIRQGDDRIVVQVPGLQDPQQLKDLIGKTARLEFRMVDTNADPNEAAAGRVPVGSEIVPYAEGAGAGQSFEVLRRQVMISGEQLLDAKQGYDGQSGQPVVNIRFDSGGSATFAKVTAQSVGKRFAMVLDGRVLSAPSINEPILGGSAQISGSFSVASANNLAISLRSGALPVKMTVVEERTVTPELGADSIRKGAIAGIIATVSVLVLMLIVYGRFGVYACIALFFNLFLIIAIMAGFNATLTLPGIAGFVLTIGAAVDANVLINERIREELKRGRRVFQAVELGYSEASRAIFDANVTNVIAAALMFWFGTGPIKGFAVVLTIGIATSVFTAVTVTRLFAARWLHAKRPTTITI
ncbi:protein translocase subunit SecD [Sphingopyxis lindanitolerans]|uniref:Protein translocase subunit SecD n=1 Tax=Sphingopyxis lindanitolerans TaxID=2054227 RepID=A0A2S8B6D3_9SPHN|nr:protein translocase subunit SecD [Sphingopyxis lindanitolerans]PQM27908.1 protein translocase subunit SecD [Sphingopyxis lindanitolerans]